MYEHVNEVKIKTQKKKKKWNGMEWQAKKISTNKNFFKVNNSVMMLQMAHKKHLNKTS